MRVQVEDEWEGWDGETVVELTNGIYLRQAEYHYEYCYAYRPMGTLEGNQLHIDGMSRPIRVEQFSPSIATVSGEWQGWDGNTVVQLDNGQVWQQAEYHYEYMYAYRPEVLIDGDQMHVRGMKKPVQVQRVK